MKIWQGPVAACGLGLLAVASLFASAQGHDSSESRRIAELLDNYVQPRFEQDAGVFGMGRIFSIPGHPHARLTAKTEDERKLLKQIDSLRHSYGLDFLRVDHPKGKATSARSPLPPVDPAAKPEPKEKRPELFEVVQTGPAWSAGYPQDTSDPVLKKKRWDAFLKLRRQREETVLKAANSAMPDLMRGNNQEGVVGKCYVAMRPVRANDVKCLGCHEGAHSGDTLGIMVYSVYLQRDPKSTNKGNEDHG